MVTPNTRRALNRQVPTSSPILFWRRFFPRRHKHPKDLLVQHLGELLGVLDLRTSKQVKSKRYLPQHRNGVAVKVYGKERLSILRLLDCETAGATVGFFRHTAQYRTELASD